MNGMLRNRLTKQEIKVIIKSNDDEIKELCVVADFCEAIGCVMAAKALNDRKSYLGGENFRYKKLLESMEKWGIKWEQLMKLKKI